MSGGQAAVKVRKVRLSKNRSTSLSSASPAVDAAASPLPSDAGSEESSEKLVSSHRTNVLPEIYFYCCKLHYLLLFTVIHYFFYFGSSGGG